MYSPKPYRKGCQHGTFQDRIVIRGQFDGKIRSSGMLPPSYYRLRWSSWRYRMHSRWDCRNPDWLYKFSSAHGALASSYVISAHILTDGPRECNHRKDLQFCHRTSIMKMSMLRKEGKER